MAAAAAGNYRITRSGRVVLSGSAAEQAEAARKLEQRIRRLKVAEEKVGKEMFKLQLEKGNYELGAESGPFKGIPKKIDARFHNICEKYGGLDECLSKTQKQIKALEEGTTSGVSDPAVDELLSALGGMTMGGGYRHKRSHRRKHCSRKRIHRRKSHKRRHH